MSESGAPDSSIVWGNPQAIRSDEYLRGSPGTVGSLRSVQSPSSISVGTPLSYSPPNPGAAARLWPEISPWLNPVTYAITAATKDAPVGIGFAWSWWWPTLIFLLAMPLFLRLLGIRWLIAIVGAWLTWLSAPVQWWSYYPIESIGPAMLGGLLVLWGLRIAGRDPTSRRRMTIGVLVAAMGGAQVPVVLSSYIVWSAPVLLFCMTLTVAGVISSAEKRRTKISILAGASVASLLTVSVWYANFHASASILLDTVYPGTRRSEGSSGVPHWIGDVVWSYANPTTGFVSSNASELSIGLLVAILVGGIAVFVTRRGSPIYANPQVFPAFCSLILLFIFLLWTMGSWPEALTRGNPLQFVNPTRMLQIIGPLGMIFYALCLQFGHAVSVNRVSRGAMFAISGVVLALSIQSNNEIRSTLVPPLTNNVLWISAAIVTVALVAPFVVAPRAPNRFWLVLVPLVVFCGFTVYKVNPIQRGLGALTNSSLAIDMVAANNGNPGRWASDGIGTDALVLATGVPQLSGQQGLGPNEETWRILDPTGADRNVWNRGASYVSFGWNEADTATFTNPSPDVISVSISPCSPLMKQLGLRWIISSAGLKQPCLVRESEGNWRGTPLTIYKVT